MNSGMRVVLVLLGVLIGAALSSSSVLVGAVLGGFIGFSIAQWSLLRATTRKLEQDVASLRRRLSESESQAPPDAAAPAAPIAAAVPADAAALIEPAVPKVSPAQQSPAQQSPPLPDNAFVAAIKRFFTGGNTLVQGGVVVLFFGVAFLLRYLAEHSHVSLEVRLSAIASSGVALEIVGWRLRWRKPGYALALQGGGVGILYLTIFAAMRLYGLLPPGLAFGLLVLIAAFSAALAVMQDSLAFALLGVIGGFLAPVLAASGEGSHVVLFSYYAILNSGVAIMAWFKAWRPLNIAGFLFTFVIATVWGGLQYQPRYFSSTEPFLILFFLLYVAIAMLFTARQPFELKGYVDGALVFGTPIAAFGLQTAMLRHDPMALAYSALFMGGVYLTLTLALKRLRGASQDLLAECFLGLGVAFLTLAIPLAFGAALNSAAWALEGAALVWIGCRQSRRAARFMGTLLSVSAAGLLSVKASFAGGVLVIPLSLLPGVILVSAACLASVWNLDRVGTLSSHEEPYAHILFVVGVLAFVFGGLGELPHLVDAHHLTAARLGFLTFTAWIASELDRRARLERAARTALLLLPVMIAFLFEALRRGIHPFAAAGGLAWPAAFAVLYVLIHRHEGPLRRGLRDALHVGSAWLLCLVLGWEAGSAVDSLVASASPEWGQAARVLPPALGLFLLPRLTRRVAWPFVAHRDLYLSVVASGVSMGLIAWSLISNVLFEGNAAPLPYVPFLNPLDVAQATVLLVVLRHWILLRLEPARWPGHTSAAAAPAVLAVSWFVWLNAVLLRSLHHWIGVPLASGALAASNVVQTSLSILWSLLALTTMLLASRKGTRSVWIAGAALLTVVIMKLFIVDLASVGSIERIVSFVGVGCAMLVVGYFSPLPPRLEES